MYAFFLDIDGTVLLGKTMSPAVIEAITRARTLGHKVFINTSRAYIGMPEEFYTFLFDGYVNSFGLEILADGRWIHRHFLPDEHVRKIAEDAFAQGRPVYFEGEVRVDIHRDGFGFQPQSVDELFDMMGDQKVCKFVLCGSPSDEERAKWNGEYDFFGGEGVAKGHNKAYGIAVLEKLFNIPHEHTVAIGDTFLDADMVAYADIGIAMGNSTPDLIACADYMTAPLAQDGVAVAINAVLDGDLGAMKKLK